MPNKMEQEITKGKKLSIISMIIGCISLMFNVILLLMIL